MGQDSDKIKKAYNSIAREYSEKLIEQAIALIEHSEKCAAGERICRAVHTDTPLTESVFLRSSVHLILQKATQPLYLVLFFYNHGSH